MKLQPIQIPLREFFKTYITCLNPYLRLKPREIEMTAILLKYYYENRGMKEDELYALLYSKEMRRKMRDEIKMTDASFNNHLVQLKAKRVLSNDGRMHKGLLANMHPKTMEITYIIEVKE